MREVELGLQQRTAELLDRYLIDHPELSGAGAGGFARDYYLAQREIESRLAPQVARYEDARRRQRLLSQRASWLSPAMAAHAALTHVAGVDGVRHDVFVGQALEFSATWRELLQRQLFADQSLTAKEIAALPRFHFVEPPLGLRAWSVVAYLLALACLGGWMLGRTLRNGGLR